MKCSVSSTAIHLAILSFLFVPGNAVTAAPEETKVRVDRPLSQYAERLTSSVESLTLKPFERTEIPVTIENTSAELWSSSGKFPITLGYKWVKGGAMLATEGARTILPGVLNPGHAASVRAVVEAPEQDGNYVLRLSLVQEGITWFISSGAAGLDIPVKVAGLADPNAVVTAFHLWFYDHGKTTWDNTHWLGTPIEKTPLDMEIYQEILWETKPDVLIETGTLRGGSAYFFASIFELMKHGRVLTIDIVKESARPQHPRITYLTGDSVGSETLAAVRRALKPGERVMVSLDSLHTKDHVLREMELYGPLVTKGNYMVVEDSNVNGHPIYPGVGPGPTEAIEAYRSRHDDFVPDSSREKYGLTFNPGGWLKKVK